MRLIIVCLMLPAITQCFHFIMQLFESTFNVTLMTFYEINYLETMIKVKIERNKNQMIQQKTTMHQQQSFYGKCLKVFFFCLNT